VHGKGRFLKLIGNVTVYLSGTCRRAGNGGCGRIRKEKIFTPFLKGFFYPPLLF
jgi:hypothetical protein